MKKKELSSKINPCNKMYFNASVKSIITHNSSLENIILGCKFDLQNCSLDVL